MVTLVQSRNNNFIYYTHLNPVYQAFVWWEKEKGGDSIQDKYYTFLNINLMCTEPKVKN